jgi:hypothetical protein
MRSSCAAGWRTAVRHPAGRFSLSEMRTNSLQAQPSAGAWHPTAIRRCRAPDGHPQVPGTRRPSAGAGHPTAACFAPRRYQAPRAGTDACPLAPVAAGAAGTVPGTLAPVSAGPPERCLAPSRRSLPGPTAEPCQPPYPAERCQPPSPMPTVGAKQMRTDQCRAPVPAAVNDRCRAPAPGTCFDSRTHLLACPSCSDWCCPVNTPRGPFHRARISG